MNFIRSLWFKIFWYFLEKHSLNYGTYSLFKLKFKIINLKINFKNSFNIFFILLKILTPTFLALPYTELQLIFPITPFQAFMMSAQFQQIGFQHMGSGNELLDYCLKHKMALPQSLHILDIELGDFEFGIINLKNENRLRYFIY